MHSNTPLATAGQLIPLTSTDEGIQAVMGRDLHKFLESNTQYDKWFDRMAEYGFSAGQDFVVKNDYGQDKLGRRREVINHIMTLDMAKEISMIQRSEKGKQARQYFIEMEKQAQNPNPLELSRKQILTMALEAEQRAEVEAERADKAEATLEEAAPAIEYHDQFVADEDLIQFRTLANQLNIGEQELKRLLIDKGWIYNDVTSRWSNKEDRMVKESRWRAHAGKKKYFRLVAHHKVPRINGEVRQTLKVTPRGAVAISRAVAKWSKPVEESMQPELDGITANV